MDREALKRRIALVAAAAPLAIGGMLFLPAGTFDFWQAWLYMAVLFAPMFFVVLYFWKKDPEFLERRLRTREKEARQGLIVRAGAAILLAGFLVPGLDRRFGWTDVPAEISIAADVIVFVGYALIFLVFKENSYAGRTIEVEKGQKVISSGPYSVVRHPMYLGVLAIYLATPLALGSYAALPPCALTIPLLVLRILNEEEVLRRDLAGYAEYCKKTKYRLIPLVW
ncbi:MAG: isoprenylcysteine carboxylmethyltransferase family protein [Candidatus Micrarchaeota archaeon]